MRDKISELFCPQKSAGKIDTSDVVTQQGDKNLILWWNIKKTDIFLIFFFLNFGLQGNALFDFTSLTIQRK